MIQFMATVALVLLSYFIGYAIGRKDRHKDYELEMSGIIKKFEMKSFIGVNCNYVLPNEALNVPVKVYIKLEK